MISRRTFLQYSRRLAVGAFGASLLSTAVMGSAQTLAAAQAQPQPPLHPLLVPLRPSLPAPDDVPLEVKIGQMVMVGFTGQRLSQQSQILAEIKEKHLGGVVLFRHNIASPVQIKMLTSTLQKAAEIPLLIATDQEGGRVSRLPNSFGVEMNFSEFYLGSKNNLEMTHTQAKSTAQILAQSGINLNLAPVVDLNLNPYNPIIARYERSYSADPTVVVKHAGATIEAHRQHQVLCTLKHFPGHGSAAGDTHAGFVDVTDTWNEIELQPFAELVRQGACDAVMTAHIFNAKLDNQRPATLSEKIVNGILRQQIGFDGVVMSDDMHMRAIAGRYSVEEAVRMAIEAGIDILAISNNIPSTKKLSASRAIAIIQRLVEEGTISRQRIDDSYRRIMRLKQKL
jgi:beta-N-acetylhexosaminidase